MLKDWNFWERNFAECVLTVYRLPMKKTQYIQPSGKLPYTTFDKVTNKCLESIGQDSGYFAIG